MPRKAHDSVLYEPAETDEVDFGYKGPGSYSDAEDAKKDSRPGVFSLNGWLKELVTCFSSLGVLAWIIYILYSMNNRPLSEWRLDGKVRLAAFIGFLTSLCAAFLMHHVSSSISQLKWLFFKAESRGIIHLERFDEASRGFLGALFLFTTPWKIRFNWALVGAAVTLLVPSFSFFIQQLIDIHPRNVTTFDGKATFGFAHVYSRNTTLVGAMRARSDLQLEAAIVKGIYGIETPPIFNCSGSCLWNQTQISLGFDVSCSNVTMSTLKNRKCSDILDGVKYYRRCNMTTPGKVALSSFQINSTATTDVYMNVTSNIMPSWTETNIRPAWSEIAKFAVYRATPEDQFSNPTNINITECSLKLAAYEYLGAASNGSNFSFNDVRRIDLSNKNWDWNLTGSVVNPDTVLKLHDDKLPSLEISIVDCEEMARFLTSSPIVSTRGVGLDNSNPGISNALSGDVDLQSRFDTMAMSMTDYLRSGPNGQKAEGYKVEVKQYVSIYWKWGILPAAVTMLAFFFTVVTIIWTSMRREVPLWKASTLAVLNCHYDEKSELIRSTIKDPRRLKKKAKKNVGHLEHRASV